MQNCEVCPIAAIGEFAFFVRSQALSLINGVRILFITFGGHIFLSKTQEDS